MNHLINHHLDHALSLSVVLPAYNEADNIGRVINSAVKYLAIARFAMKLSW